MQKQERGYWACITSALQPGDLYSFYLQDGKKYPDPASLSQPQGVHGPSQVLNLRKYQWNDSRWINPSLEEYILYELHTGAFTASGTFEGIEERLDYLKKLGITAIEIMPVAQFPGDRNWGYDGVFPFAVQHSYGGAEGLQQLVDACHQKEIAVVLDVVYNHLGPEGNILSRFGSYFTNKYKTPWGDAVNFDDAGCDEVRHYFIENALMWFRDFHIDALRLDAVHAIKDFSPVHFLKELRWAVDELIRQTGKIHYLIVECDLNDNRFIHSTDRDGYGMDAQWMDEFHHALRVAAGHNRTGYYADFDGLIHLAKSYKDGYVYDGIYSSHRQKTFGTKANNIPGKQFVVFSQNHDHVGNRMLGERTSTLLSFEKQKLVAGAVLISPYLPLLFMGEEYGEQNPFLYFVSHTEEELVQAVRNGRQLEFAAFHHEGEAPDPQSEETFNKSKLQWHTVDEEPHYTLFRYYQQLITLRKRLPSWRHPDREHLRVELLEEKQVILIERWHFDHRLFCAMNFSKVKRLINISSTSDSWIKVIDSADTEWAGPGGASQKLKSNSLLSLSAESFLVYTNRHV
jgi:maltooligosyltrehalose trehalohydrolase